MELDFLNFIQSIRSDFLDSLMMFFTTIGDKGILWLSIGILLVFFKKTRVCGIMLLSAVTLGFLLGEVTLKNIIGRIRPSTRYYDVMKKHLLILPSSYSFPSGHTTSSFAAAFIIFMCNKRCGICAYLVASLIAFSRMYLYVHYPTDIIAGIILGTLSAGLVYFITVKKLNKRPILYKES